MHGCQFCHRASIVISHSYLPVTLLDVHKTRIFHRFPLDSFVHDSKRAPRPLAGLDVEFGPLAYSSAVRDLFVVAHQTRRGFGALNPTPWLAGSVRISEELVPVLNGAKEKPHVDIVDRILRKGPRAGAVLDLTRTPSAGE